MTQRAECEEADWIAPKSFVLKILISKFFVLKILRTCFCETRAQQGIQRGWGRGVLRETPIFPKPGTAAHNFISLGNPQQSYRRKVVEVRTFSHNDCSSLDQV